MASCLKIRLFGFQESIFEARKKLYLCENDYLLLRSIKLEKQLLITKFSTLVTLSKYLQCKNVPNFKQLSILQNIKISFEHVDCHIQIYQCLHAHLKTPKLNLPQLCSVSSQLPFCCQHLCTTSFDNGAYCYSKSYRLGWPLDNILCIIAVKY